MDARVEEKPAAERPQPAERQPPRTAEPTRTPDDANTDTSSKGESKKPNILRRHPGWVLLGVVALIALGVVVYFVWLVYFHPFESTDDAFVDARTYSVAAKVSGYVTDAPLADNQHVQAGDTLFQIDRRDYETALAQAEAQVAQADAAIKNIDAQIEMQKAQIAAAQAEVDQNQAAVAFAQSDAARYKDLAKTGYGTVQQSQSTSSTLQQRQASLAQAQASLISAQKQVGSLQAQRGSAEAQLAGAKAQRDQAKLNLSYTTVVAVEPGRVVRLTGAKGQYAQAGQGLAMFVPDDIWVTANFKETQVTDMRPGQAVDIEIDAYPDHKITGHVDSVQPGSGTAFSLLPAENATGNYVKVVQRVPVKIVADHWPTDVSIGPGMSIVPTVRVR